MKLVVLLVLAGCNQIFGLRETVANDNLYFDAPIDAPYACPAIGTAPQFSHFLHQVAVQNVLYYAVTTSGRAAGLCPDSSGFVFQVCEGPVDGSLAGARGLPLSGDNTYVPRLSQDGQRMYVLAGISTYLYRRNADDSWTAGPSALPLPALAIRGLAPPAFVGGHDRLLLETQVAGPLEEWTDEGGTWHKVLDVPTAPLGIANLRRVSMTADGLRALAYGINPDRTYYTDRPSLDQPFGAATPLPNVALSEFLYLTTDCARVYATGLGQVFYHQQL